MGPRVGLVRGRLVERDAELGEIDRAVAGAAAGDGWLVLLEGPAGIGKTALLDAARERAEGSGLTVLPARGTELEGGFPYGVIRQLLEPTLRAASDSRQERLLAGSASLATPAVLGPSVAPAAGADPGFAIVHGLYWLVANLASEAPLALLLDDVHWADAPSLRFIVYLARRLDGLAVTVIASVRSGEPGSDQTLVNELRGSPQARLVSPAALSDAGVTSVLAADFGQQPDAEFARACREVTGGNPFYVRELTAALKADGITPTAAATERISAAAPPTIARSTLTRVGRLSDDAVQLARAIAVLGADATLPRAAALAQLDDQQGLTALDALVDADVIPANPGFEFRHPIVRAAIYDEIRPGARSTAHRQAAIMLTAEAADLDAVAGHLLQSRPIGDPTTIQTLRDAAAHALTLGAPDSAATYLARALEEGPERQLRTTVLLELGLAAKLARQPAAVTHLEEVRRVADDPVTHARATIEIAEMLVVSGDWQQPLAMLDSALAELGDRDHVLALRADALRAAMTAYDVRLVDSFERRLPTLNELVAHGGDAARPLAMLLAAVGSLRGDPRDRVCSLVERGWDSGGFLAAGVGLEVIPQGISALLPLEELDRATEIVDALREDARSRGSVIEFVMASTMAAWIETRLGNLVAAEAELRGCCERALEFGVHFAIPTVLWGAADVLLERPDTADLVAFLETIEIGPLAEIVNGAFLLEARGRLRFAAGEREPAIADIRQASSITSRLGFDNPNLFPWRSTLASMLAPDQGDEGLELVTAELAGARRIGQPRAIGVTLRTLGTLEPDRDKGGAHLEEALSVLADSPARLEHARALVELGAGLRRAGNRAAARHPLRDGLDLATRCGAIRLAERARTELAATGARPRRAHTTGRDALTPSERRVAQLAAEGRTSQEIAQALFVTTKTIDGHLNHTYTKLGINSRKQLAEALATSHD